MNACLRFACYLILALPVISFGQKDVPYSMRLTSEHGLADNWVHTVMQDSHGFLWFGTEGGLSRFDGLECQNFFFEKGNSQSISNNSVMDICEAPDGTFWIAVLDGGLNHFDPATGKFESWKTDPVHPEWGDAPLSLLSIHQDGDLLWIGSYHHALGCFDKKKKQYVGWYSFGNDAQSANTFGYNSVNEVIQDRRNPDFLWIAANNRGLAHFDKTTKRFDIFPIVDATGTSGVAAMKLFEDKDGIVWVATWSAGLAGYDSSKRHFEMYPYSIPHWKKANSLRNVVQAIVEKNDDEIYFGTLDHGFGVFHKTDKTFTFYENNFSGESPELDRQCEGLYLDKQKKLWVLGKLGGARCYSFQNQAFRYVSLSSGNGKTERAEVTDFAFNQMDKSIVVATANSGCFEWNQKEGRLTQLVKPLLGGTYPGFQNVFTDSRGNVWAGANKTLGGVATLYIKEIGRPNFEPFIPRPATPTPFEETVNDIMEDASGNIWVATSYAGLYRISPDRQKIDRFNDQEGFGLGLPRFPQWWVFLKIKEDSRGHLIILLKKHGILDFDPKDGIFKKYDEVSLGLPGVVTAMELANDGNLWLGVNNKGLIQLAQNQDSYHVVTVVEGIPGNLISSIGCDNKDNIWVNTNKGLARYNFTHKQLKIFAKNEGLKDSYLMDKGLAVFPEEGVFVGQPNGFCNWRNADVPINNLGPVSVVLTDVKIFGRSCYFEKNIRNASEISLTPAENVFSFEFASPTVSNADLIAYQFKLDRFDERWYDAEGRKSITYTDLLPGRYVFRVRAKPSGKQQSGTSEAQLAICVLPHWYQTWWFVTGMVALFAVGVWRFVHYRTAQVRREEQLKTAFYKELSEKEMTALRSQMNPHFIFNCLNSINNFIVRNNSEQAASYVTKFSRLMRLVLDNSQSQRVPLEKELQALRLYMDLEAMRFDGKFRYEIWVDDAVDEQYVEIPPMLIQPYIENAIWHGLMHKPEGGSVVVDVRQTTEDVLHIEITDDGVGRERAAILESKTALEHKSKGSLITAERLRNINFDNPKKGNVTIHDLVDAGGQPCGTKVVLEIPV